MSPQEVQTVCTAMTPRGSLVAAELFSRLMHATFSRQRPVAPHVAEAAAARELAHAVEDSDPAFAADLIAAAAHHEALDD